MKKLISLLLVMITMMSFFAVDIGSTSAASKATVKKIAVTNLTNKKFYVAKGKSLVLKTKVTATPNNSKNKAVTYKSNNVKIAKVNSKGKVTGVKVGNAKITVTSKINNKKKITVNVKITTPIKKITLNRSSVTLAEKKSVTLKPKFTPGKNVCKAVKYATSNKNVATVNSKGIVTAKKPGTAKITATAVDGTNKRAVCSVKAVTNYSIASLKAGEMKNSCTYKISVTLNRAKRLSPKDITVRKKLSSGSLYNKKYTVTYLYTLDNKKYDIYFNDCFFCGDYVKVNIASMTGTKTKVLFINSKNFVDDTVREACSTVGSYYDSTITSIDSIGTVSVKIVSGSLPQGIKLSAYGDRNYAITGTFEKICNNKRCVFEITDEYKHKQRVTYQFNVGDAKHIYGSNVVFGTKSDPFYSKTTGLHLKNIYMCGGSGVYNLALENNYNGLFSLSDKENVNNGFASVYFYNNRYDEFNIKSKYNLTVNITDANDPSLKGSLKIVYNVIKSNEVKFNNSKYIDKLDYEIVAVDKKTKTEYKTAFASTAKNIKTDTLYLPDGTYDIYRLGRTYGTTLVSSNLKISKDRTVNLKMPKEYRVNFLFKDKNNNPVSANYSLSIVNPYNLYNYTESSYRESRKLGFLYGEKNTFEVKVKNRYSLKAVATYKKVITVKNNMNIVIRVEEDRVSSMDVPDLIINDVGTYNIGLTRDYYSIVKFTPQTTRDYTIYSTGNYDTYIKSYEAELSPYNYTYDDDGGEKHNFKMTKNFTAGQTYYFAINKYSSTGKIYNINIVIE